MKYCLFIFIVIASSCATFSKTDRPTPTTAAEKAFYQAEDALESGEFGEAVLRYNRVKRRFPYSKFSALSDLRIGDSYFEQQEFPSAVEQYRGFRKLHPNHPKVPYASWRIADSYYQNLPSEFFAYPPIYEKELSRSKDAEREFKRFLKKYGETKWAPQAQKRLIRVRRILADHEFYVAEFYMNKGNPRAAALRLSHLLANYSGLGLDPNALFLLGRAYLELKDVDKATVALNDLVTTFPSHELAQEAKSYLQTHSLN